MTVTLLIGASSAFAQTAVVVVAKSTHINALSSITLRKVYFGIPTTVEGHAIRAVRNMSSDQLNQVFLQTLVSMTESDYDRRLLTLATQNGRPRPEQVSDVRAVIDKVKDNPGWISIVWLSDLNPEDMKSLAVVRTLWQSD